MTARRVAGLTALAVGAASVLTGCSAGINGVAAIGYDADRNLVGGVKVCHADAGSARLFGGDTDLGKWHRTTKGHGTETWRLTDKADGHWVRDSPSPATDADDGQLQFDVVSWGGPQWHTFVDVSVDDLAALPAGHLLIVDERAAASSKSDVLPTKVIPIDELSGQPCPSP